MKKGMQVYVLIYLIIFLEGYFSLSLFRTSVFHKECKNKKKNYFILEHKICVFISPPFPSLLIYYQLLKR